MNHNLLYEVIHDIHLLMYMPFIRYLGFGVFVYCFFRFVWSLLNNIATFFFSQGSVDFKKYGSWAVITGCTDGIGKEFATQLAKRGLNLVLISRTLGKLEDLAHDLEELYSIRTLVVAVDFNEPDLIYPRIRSAISDLDIGLLVNNVGVCYKCPQYFHEFCNGDTKNDHHVKAVSDMINCNIMSMTKMTAIVLPKMLEKKRGIIINNASGAGRVPTPYLTTYSACKAYVDFFSRCLIHEYKSKGIIVQSLCPYLVATKLSTMQTSLIVPSPQKFVHEQLKTIRTQKITNGCLIHNLLGWFLENILPEWIWKQMSHGTMVDMKTKRTDRLSLWMLHTNQ